MSRKIPNKTEKSREKPATGVFYVQQSEEYGCAKNNLALYKLVYKTRFSGLFVMLLLTSFLVQSIPEARAEALAESAIDTEITAPIDNLPESPTLDSLPAADLVEMDSEVESDESSLDTAQVEFDNEIDSNVEDTTALDIEEEEDILDSEEELVGEAETLDPSFEDLHDDIFITEDSATSSEDLSEVVAVAYSDDSFSFNKAECTELASGSFYCNRPTENKLEDALFAAKDADGDLEIYLIREGIETQVTYNETDDAAPFFDKNSNSLVWHRLVDDRYQIISYDVESGAEEQLTFTPENNMEPNRQGKYTVWQRWSHGGWNIVLHDGRDETEITNTTSHNVAPYIHGSIVVWNRHDQVNDRTIEMYDLTTKTYVSIEDPDGMSVANPRMVFVYDSLSTNGDIVTKGYDMIAKKFINLDTLPRSLPEDLPVSDSTGETRALIQTKPGGKSEIEEVTELAPRATTTSSNLLDGIASTSNDINIAAFTLDLTAQNEIVTNPTVEEPTDLVIEAKTADDLPEPEEVVEFVYTE